MLLFPLRAVPVAIAVETGKARWSGSEVKGEQWRWRKNPPKQPPGGKGDSSEQIKETTEESW